MNVVRRRSEGVQALTLVGVFILGPLLGIALASVVAPQSGVVGMVSALTFPLVAFGGLMAWLGLAVLSLLLDLLMCLLRREWPDRAGADEFVVPRGHGAFLWMGLGGGVLAGLIAGAASVTWPLFAATLAYALVGVVYGALLDRLARAGWLPFPDGG